MDVARGMLILSLLGILLPAGAALPTTPEDVFADNSLHTIHLHIPAELFKLMEPSVARRAAKSKSGLPNAGDIDLRSGNEGFAYVRAKIEFDGRALDNVGIRLKGHFSYSASRNSIRRPMKLDFERFESGQRFAGLAALNLNNHAVDPSQARETLAFEFFRALGVPSPRTSFALVYLHVPGLHDKEFLGLYTLIEEVDNKFLRRHFGSADGVLFKPGGMRGIAYLGEEWAPYAPKWNAKDELTAAQSARLIEFSRLIHKSDDAAFRDSIESFLDVDGLLRYVAVCGAICDFDSFLSTGHNYYFYLDPMRHRLVIIPWDMNMSFGGYSWVGSEAEIADTSIIHPYVDHNRLIERILAIPQHRQAYLRHVRALIDGPMSPANVRQRLAAIAPHIRAAGEASARAGAADSPTTRPASYERVFPPDLPWFVEARVESIRRQLEGGHTGYIPNFFNPERVPARWGAAALPGAAILKAVDTDKDGNISDAEFAAVVGRALPNELPADRSALAKAIATFLPGDAEAASNAWALWLVKQADENRDARLTAAEINGYFVKMRTRCDRDHDGQMGGRELVEALNSAKCPDVSLLK